MRPEANAKCQSAFLRPEGIMPILKAESVPGLACTRNCVQIQHGRRPGSRAELSMGEAGGLTGGDPLCPA